VAAPEINRSAPVFFVVNAAAGSAHGQDKREVIETALKNAGRTGQIMFSSPADLPDIARQAVTLAHANHSAVIAVGGDGTINTVSQAAHAPGCVMGVIPQGTFNYFARSHGIPISPALAAQSLFDCDALPVQVATMNQRIFLVNASLGLYPQLLEDREAYKARFGRSRWVALGAACVTLLRAHRQLRLHIELGNSARDVRTSTLFVGNNRLQLEQVGVQVGQRTVGAPDDGSIAAVMLKPTGTLAMMRLILRGAMGTLGEEGSIESFAFDHMVVRPRLDYGRSKIKVAFDGEVQWMRTPIEFVVPSKPLYLLRPALATSFAAAPSPLTPSSA
jgi:diacylglycerol kinase family enzyme